MKRFACILFASLLLNSGNVSAGLISIYFGATAFEPVVGTAPSPAVDPLLGAVSYFTSGLFDLGAPITSLYGIGMQVPGHIFELSEVGFDSSTPGVFAVGGTAGGLLDVTPDQPDFLLRWHVVSGTLVPDSLSYSVGDGDVWLSHEFTRFFALNAPEPATAALVLLAFVALMCARPLAFRST